MRFYLVVNLDKANAADCAAEAAAELLRCGAEVLLTPELNDMTHQTGSGRLYTGEIPASSRP